MNVQKVLELADELVFDKTGKHLDDLQVSILKGVWGKQQYTEIAEEYRCSEGHVRDISYELWRVLSEALGESVRKSNLKAVFERSQVNFVVKDFVHIGDINVCDNSDQPKKQNKHLESIRKLTELGLSAEQIADALSLSVENVREILSNVQKQ